MKHQLDKLIRLGGLQELDHRMQHLRDQEYMKREYSD